MKFYTEMPLPNVVAVEIDGKLVGYGKVTGGETPVIKPEYMLFLRAQKDGKYIPVSGQRFAGLSFRIINK